MKRLRRPLGRRIAERGDWPKPLDRNERRGSNASCVRNRRPSVGSEDAVSWVARLQDAAISCYRRLADARLLRFCDKAVSRRQRLWVRQGANFPLRRCSATWAASPCAAGLQCDRRQSSRRFRDDPRRERTVRRFYARRFAHMVARQGSAVFADPGRGYLADLASAPCHAQKCSLSKTQKMTSWSFHTLTTCYNEVYEACCRPSIVSCSGPIGLSDPCPLPIAPAKN